MAEPFVTDILKQGFRISVELVPSMIDHEGHPTLAQVMSGLAKVNPSFISVTQRAGGGSREQSAHLLKALETYKIPRCAHLICGYATRDEVLRHAANFYSMGVRNFLVLKGDAPTGPHLEGDYEFASDCIRELRQKYGRDICIGAAAYPDAHHFDRVEVLREKVEAGADFAITQMCFNAQIYADLAREFEIPIIPGTCFIPDEKRAKNFRSRFNAAIPPQRPKFWSLISEFEASGAPASHLFLLNDLSELS